MSKNKSIQEKLEGRTPATMRQLIKPVDMLEQEQQAELTNERPYEQINERSDEHTNERIKERSNERTNARINERSNERPPERPRVRHSFDIYQDQLISLKEIALSRQKITGGRILLGDLVQEALDTFIERERKNV